jgi:hypothetical protein
VHSTARQRARSQPAANRTTLARRRGRRPRSRRQRRALVTRSLARSIDRSLAGVPAAWAA